VREGSGEAESEEAEKKKAWASHEATTLPNARDGSRRCGHAKDASFLKDGKMSNPSKIT
jgi:hypothetical protein